MVKLVGVLMIGISAAMMGLQLSLQMKARIDLLREIQYALEEMSAEAEYAMEILPRIIENTAAKTSSYCKAWLQALYGKIKNTGEYGFREAYRESLAVFKNSGLKDGDIAVIETLADKIVNRDGGRLSAVFQGTIRELSAHRTELEAEYREKSKLYRTLGLLFGLFVIIIVI
ncbi:MAG: stage III sporulation protein AB [Alistipes sp.]|nr:stage III sporulation protein AB [Alistipes sp.]